MIRLPHLLLIVLGLCGHVGAAAQSISRPPWIVALDEHSVTIAWLTVEDCPDHCELSDGEKEWSGGQPESSRLHVARFDDLRPGRLHRYRTGGGFGGEFSTPGPGETLRFGVIGHTGGSESVSALDPAARVAALTANSPDFILHCGDLLETSTFASFEKNFGAVFGDYARRRPVYVVPGNHEAAWPHLAGTDWSFFRAVLPQSFDDPVLPLYRFRRGPLEVFVMASYALQSLEDPQIEAVAAALRASTAELRIVAFGGHNYTTSSGLDRLEVERTVTAKWREAGAELFLAGDGPGARTDRLPDGSTLYFTGASSVFRMVEVLPYELRVESWDGTRRTEIRHYFSRRPKATVIDLLADPRTKRKGFAEDGVTLVADDPEFSIQGLGLDRSKISGIEVTLTFEPVPGPKRGALPFDLEFRPTWEGPTGAANFSWFRAERSEIDLAKGPVVARAAFPATLPYVGETYRVEDLRLTFQAKKAEVRAITVSGCRIFVDP